MMTMTTLTANHTPPRHSPQTTNISKPSPTREGSITPKSNGGSKNNKSYEPSKFLCGSPTKTSSHPSNSAAIDLLVDNDDRHPQSITTTPNPTLLQEWQDFSAKFNDFFLEFAKFRMEYDHLTDDQANDASTLLACSINDDNDQTAKDSDSTSFLHVIGELEKVNSQFFQLLEKN